MSEHSRIERKHGEFVRAHLGADKGVFLIGIRKRGNEYFFTAEGTEKGLEDVPDRFGEWRVEKIVGVQGRVL